LTPSLCVAICTHNRARYLDRALDSLLAQDIGAEFFDTLVVDNGSTDDTRALVKAHADVLPNLHYVHEPRLGLSRARNRATEESRRKFIAFLDDDAVADPGWVSALLSAFQSMAPSPVCIGGRVELIWETPRPDWLPEELLGYLSAVNWAEQTTRVDPFKQYLAGANMAFSTCELRSVGGFDTRLGRVGNNLISGEELLVQRRLHQKGLCLLYDPRVLVRHHVPASRLNRRWFYQRVFAQGVTETTLDRIMQSPEMYRDIPRALAILLRTLLAPRLLAGLLFPARDRRSVARKCNGLKQLGRARGHLLTDTCGNRAAKGARTEGMQSAPHIPRSDGRER
jgi:glucosyl-dolichyl phosphate glucuronosyltransferase